MGTYKKTKEQEKKEYTTFKNNTELPLNALRILTNMTGFNHLVGDYNLLKVLKENESYLEYLKSIMDCTNHVEGEDMDTGNGYGKNHYERRCIHCGITLFSDWY